VTTPEQIAQISALTAREGEPADTRWQQAGAALAKGEAPQAVALLEELAKEFPLTPAVLDRLAEASEATGDAARAESARAQAKNQRRLHSIQMRKDDSDVLQRISLLDAMGAYERSQTFHDALMALVPENWILPNNRAYELAFKEQFLHRALELAEKGVALSGERSACLDTLGWVQMKMKRFDDALRTFEKVVEKEPKSAFYRYHFGVVYLEKGEKDKARTMFEEALKLKPAEGLEKTIRASIEKAS
jgi:tetratricopeptide (TPR) repeat protein